MTLLIRPLQEAGTFELSDGQTTLHYTMCNIAIEKLYGYASPIISSQVLDKIPPKWIDAIPHIHEVIDAVKVFENYLWQKSFIHDGVYPVSIMSDAFLFEEMYSIKNNQPDYSLTIKIKGDGYIIQWCTAFDNEVYPVKIQDVESEGFWWEEAYKIFNAMKQCQFLVHNIHEDLKPLSSIRDYIESYYGKNGIALQQQAQIYHQHYAPLGLVTWYDFKNNYEQGKTEEMSIII